MKLLNNPFSADKEIHEYTLEEERGKTKTGEFLEKFLAEFKPSYLFLNGQFYRKLEHKLYVECRAYGEAQSSELQTSMRTANEGKLNNTERDILGFR